MPRYGGQISINIKWILFSFFFEGLSFLDEHSNSFLAFGMKEEQQEAAEVLVTQQEDPVHQSGRCCRVAAPPPPSLQETPDTHTARERLRVPRLGGTRADRSCSAAALTPLCVVCDGERRPQFEDELTNQRDNFSKYR